MVGSFLGSVLAGVGISPAAAVGLIAICLLPCVLLLVRALPVESREKPTDTQPGMYGFSMPSRALINVCLFAFGIAITEGAIADWSAVYLRELYADV